MEVPKFLKCPECEEKYSDKKKRRIIDSCGHPRCFSCLVLDNQCTVCETILGRRRSLIKSHESLLSTDENQYGRKTDRVSALDKLFSKEQYLRTLYSYDPNHRNPRQNSPLEVNFSQKTLADKQVFECSMSNSNKGNIKTENERRCSLGDENSSHTTSPRSSGYWSEIESDQEGNVFKKENHPVWQGDKTKIQIQGIKKENCVEEEIISVKKSNEDLHELVQDRTIEKITRDDTGHDWRLRKYFDCRSNNTSYSSLRTTNL